MWCRAGLAAVLLLLSVPARAEQTLRGPYLATVTGITDGDTLKVRVSLWIDLETVTAVRLRGIDAPEIRGRCDAEKTLAVQARGVLGRETTATVLLRNVARDKYAGRVEADVYTVPDGLDLARAMLASGLARPYNGGKRGDWCGTAEVGR
jgi:endonuclease YncB( thermonuclease family)